jgi:hypothetical protein
MPTYEINPNNAGSISLALEGITPLVEYACQVTDIVLEPTQNTTTTPGTYCAAPHDSPGASSWAIVISFLQDWGNTPSLSEFTFTNDGALCDFEFTSANPASVPDMSGQVFVTATAFGGPAGEAWAVTTQRWPCNAKPTLTPSVLLTARGGKAKESANA